MELLLILIFILMIGTFLFFKSKLDARFELIISSIAGSFLLVWFWIAADSIHWKIIVTVVVASSLIKLLRKCLKPRNNNTQ